MKQSREPERCGVDATRYHGGMAMPVTICGEIQAGLRGGAAGLPTANVAIVDDPPQAGGYAAIACLPDGVQRPALALVGTDLVLRTFIFDFHADVTGQSMATRLIAFLRPDKTFEDDDALRRQLLLDCRGARLLLELTESERTIFQPRASDRGVGAYV
jgi:FAD synthase